MRISAKCVSGCISEWVAGTCVESEGKAGGSDVSGGQLYPRRDATWVWSCRLVRIISSCILCYRKNTHTHDWMLLYLKPSVLYRHKLVPVLWRGSPSGLVLEEGASEVAPFSLSEEAAASSLPQTESRWQPTKRKHWLEKNADHSKPSQVCGEKHK